MTSRRLAIAAATAAVIAMATAVPGAHITPQVTLRSKADVIRAALPEAAHYAATTVQLSRSQLQQIAARAHYTPNTDAIRFYKGMDANEQTLGTVVFPQVDTQHGPIEAGVAIGPEGAIMHVSITRVTVETKPWAAAVDRSGVLDRLRGMTPGQTPQSLSGDLHGMPGYVADAVATAANRGLILYDVLQP